LDFDIWISMKGGSSGYSVQTPLYSIILAEIVPSSDMVMPMVMP